MAGLPPLPGAPPTPGAPPATAPGIGGASGSAGGGVLTPGGTVPGGGGVHAPPPTNPGSLMDTGGGMMGSALGIGSGFNAGITDPGFKPENPTPLSGGVDTATPGTPPAPPAPPPATAPGVGTPAPSALTSAPTAQFGAQPGENLIGTEINPTASPNTSAFQADTAKLGNEITNNRPDLTAATKAAYDSWITEQNPVFQKAMRDAEAQAAATGSLGSGQLETGLGSLADQFAREAMAAETSGELNAKQQDFSNTVTGAGALSNLEGQSFGQDTANANALRGERGYQEGLQQTAVGNAAAQENQQLAAQAQQADLAMKEAELGLSTTPASFKAGMGDTYANQGQQAAQTGGNVAGQGSYMDAFARMKAAMDGGGTAGGGGAPTDTGGVGTGGAFGNAGQPSPTSGATPLGNGLYQQADGTVIDENGNPVLPAYAGGDTQNNFATV